jgi:hypothetical protein
MCHFMCQTPASSRHHRHGVGRLSVAMAPRSPLCPRNRFGPAAPRARGGREHLATIAMGSGSLPTETVPASGRLPKTRPGLAAGACGPAARALAAGIGTVTGRGTPGSADTRPKAASARWTGTQRVRPAGSGSRLCLVSWNHPPSSRGFRFGGGRRGSERGLDPDDASSSAAQGQPRPQPVSVVLRLRILDFR